ncbi:MAG: UvrD-helicase domain-containing protein [Deltaproteobacteria bacterium]|nr:UvrD-helicase domain-containing protein [Deltaproteobacteria bacterium]MBW2123683.1 UvrD-helicase domain-containing protein [Deltaproteobacteria bacterium]
MPGYFGGKSGDSSSGVEKYEKILDENRLLTFGRIVSLAIERLESNPESLPGVRHLIVDEYQDINRAQEHFIS